METERNRARDHDHVRGSHLHRVRTVKKSLFRVWSQQEDLPNPAFLSQCMCFSHIAQRHRVTNRQN